MAENKDEQLTDEELAQLQLAEENENAVDRLVQELGCPTRRIRQFAARVLHLAVNGMTREAVVAMTNSTPFAAASERLGYALMDWRQRIDAQAEGLRP